MNIFNKVRLTQEKSRHVFPIQTFLVSISCLSSCIESRSRAYCVSTFIWGCNATLIATFVIPLIWVSTETITESSGSGWFAYASLFAFYLASYLVIPIMVMEKMGPLEALKESGQMVRKIWGEQVVGNIGFGVFFSLILLPMFVIIPMLVAFDNVVWYFIGISVLVIYITLVSLLHSTLLSIFQGALYLYAREDYVPDGYDRSVLSESVAKD